MASAERLRNRLHAVSTEHVDMLHGNLYMQEQVLILNALVHEADSLRDDLRETQDRLMTSEDHAKLMQHIYEVLHDSPLLSSAMAGLDSLLAPHAPTVQTYCCYAKTPNDIAPDRMCAERRAADSGAAACEQQNVFISAVADFRSELQEKEIRLDQTRQKLEQRESELCLLEEQLACLTDKV